MARSIKYKDNILIARPIEDVFDMLTDVKRVSEWDNSVLDVEVINKGPWSERTKAIWHLKSGKEVLEMVEVVTAFSRPDIVSSTFELTRFMPPTPKQIEDRKLPNINHEYELREQFIFRFGNGSVTGAATIELTDCGSNETTLLMSIELIAGGYVATADSISRIFRRKPLKKILKHIKKTAETMPEHNNE